MSTFVFLGPSLDVNQAKAILPTAQYLPPIACGDIISILPLNPQIIVIIDGYFENQPAVWHKEIMYVMSLGIIVCGASSMGALRAAELYHFGMIGIGKIYESYKNLTIIGDDEVVLTHSFEMDNFKPYTLPMINIRVSVEHAIAQKIISPDMALEFIGKIKNIFYQDRTWELLEAEFKKSHKFNQVFIWLKNNYIDQKQFDAKEVLYFVNNNKFPLKTNIKLSNTALLRNLKIEKLSMPLSFFYKWLPIDCKISLALCFFA